MNIFASPIQNRLAAARRQMLINHLDAILVTSRENNRYLSGFSGTESWLLITADLALILVDFRYLEQAAVQCAGFRVVDYTKDRLGALSGLIQKESCHRIGVEEDDLSWGFSIQLQEQLPDANLRPVQTLLGEMRSIKDETEVAMICQAVDIAETALQELLPTIRPGQTEIEIAARLENNMRARGADGPSFATIIASGPRSALPHGVASDRQVRAGDSIVMDFGCKWHGYCSDMTRTYFLGDPGELARRVYGIVLEAQLQGAAALHAGLTGIEADQVARRLITAEGYGPKFGHGLGHGVGLAIHEAPRLSQTYSLPLISGQIVTVEPGIYLPGQFGIRIEDMALIQPDGSRNLNSLSKALTVLPIID